MVRPTVRALEKKLKSRFQGRRRFDFGTNEVNETKIFIYPNQEVHIKIENHFTPSYIRTSSFDHLVQNEHLILYFLLGIFSGNFYIFHFFRCNGLNAYDMPVPMSELPMSEVHCGGSSWLASLNFMVDTPARTIFNPRNELHSLKLVDHMHSDRIIEK